MSSRRLFLRHSALAALGLTVPGWPGWAVQDQKPDEKKEDKEAAKLANATEPVAIRRKAS